MKDTMSPLEIQQRQAAEVYAPRGAALLRKWREAIETAARAHLTLGRMADGPRKRRLRQKLERFHRARVAAARSISADVSRNEKTVIDFEELAGTAMLTTDPARPNTGTVAPASQLGVWPLVIGAGAAIIAVWKIADSLSKEIVEWSGTLMYVGVVGLGLWGLYRLVKTMGAGRESAQPRIVGETWG